MLLLQPEEYEKIGSYAMIGLPEQLYPIRYASLGSYIQQILQQHWMNPSKECIVAGINATWVPECKGNDLIKDPRWHHRQYFLILLHCSSMPCQSFSAAQKRIAERTWHQSSKLGMWSQAKWKRSIQLLLVGLILDVVRAESMHQLPWALLGPV